MVDVQCMYIELWPKTLEFKLTQRYEGIHLCIVSILFDEYKWKTTNFIEWFSHISASCNTPA